MGGAIDLSGSTGPRAQESERRIVLSQYLTAIQCSGNTPPQETGLTCNSWYGKFHLECIGGTRRTLRSGRERRCWSAAWAGTRRFCPSRGKAARQGYRGARWPKMTSPGGHESPSSIGELLIWQQPHPIATAELCYQAHPDSETLARYADVVLKTAEFMADFACHAVQQAKPAPRITRRLKRCPRVSRPCGVRALRSPGTPRRDTLRSDR